jgi:hypothetical protein
MRVFELFGEYFALFMFRIHTNNESMNIIKLMLDMCFSISHDLVLVEHRAFIKVGLVEDQSSLQIIGVILREL